MPRKTDGIEFEIHPRPTKGEDGKPLLYVRPAKGRKKSFKQLEDFCNKYRNLRTGELQMVMDIMMDVVGLWLSDGYRVETPIGSFAPKLKLLGNIQTPRPFMAETSFMRALSSSLPRSSSGKAARTARAIARVMLRWVTARCTTRKQWTRLCDVA
ncbi:MAG: hypothetical protein IJQ49_03600 [Prevotella sp.]|nr:hypothetical protein [Prevotella sp.]